jgi:hypothetical protein
MNPLPESLEIPQDGFDEMFWEDLLAYIEEKRVIPIIGPDIVSVVAEGQEVPLYTFVAKKLAERLSIAESDLPEPFSLNDVVCQHLRAGRRREDVYPRLRAILRDTHFAPPKALVHLAQITDFNLFVTTTFDSLLEEAINSTRFNGVSGTEVLAYTPTRLVDLPSEKERLQRTTVYHLLGKVAATPSYAICDEDVLEFLHTLQSQNFCPDKLFSELETNHLLILGCNFSDWLGRFFLRTAKRRRLSEMRAELEVIADSRSSKDPNLVLFLHHVSSRTRIFSGGDAGKFVAELWTRWQALQPAAQTSESGRGEALRFLPPAREMPAGAIFISYAREDLEAAKQMKAGLDAGGFTAWFDMDRLGAGDDYDRKIQRNINHCSFFVALISAVTDRRVEGYFRREWSYALDRVRNIADQAIFIIPVAIGDASVTSALVPERFKAVHWENLPGGIVSPQFAQRLRELTGGGGHS